MQAFLEMSPAGKCPRRKNVQRLGGMGEETGGMGEGMCGFSRRICQGSHAQHHPDAHHRGGDHEAEVGHPGQAATRRPLSRVAGAVACGRQQSGLADGAQQRAGRAVAAPRLRHGLAAVRQASSVAAAGAGAAAGASKQSGSGGRRPHLACTGCGRWPTPSPAPPRPAGTPVPPASASPAAAAASPAPGCHVGCRRQRQEMKQGQHLQVAGAEAGGAATCMHAQPADRHRPGSGAS